VKHGTAAVPDSSDVLREAVEVAQNEFSLACAAGVSQEIKRAAAVKLERAILRLTDYILHHILPRE
jgi:hypothetical protein